MAATARNSRGAKRRAVTITDAASFNRAMLRAINEAVGSQPDPYRRKLTLPDLPPGVRGAGSPTLAMDDAGATAAFSWLSTAQGAAAFGMYFPGYPWLAENAQRTEYRQPVETTAKELTRKWITFRSRGKGDKAKKIQRIEKEFQRFNVQEVFRKAAVHDGFYGMGSVFIKLKRQDQSLPLVISEKTIAQDSLEGFVNIEPIWMSPLTYNATDPTLPTFYKPEAWMVLGKKTSADRLLNFISREVPDIIKPAYNFGGVSLTQLIQPYVERWLKTVSSVNRLINNFSIIALATDMASGLANSGGQGKGASLATRAKLFTHNRDNQGLFLLDKNLEELTQLSVPIGGLSELQAQAQEHMAAPTHLPLVVLTGITPAGLNASSDGEIEVYHDWIHSQQEAMFSDHLDKVLKIIQLNAFGSIDEDITYEYVPLKELDGEALARNRKMAADAAVAYVQAGITTPEEERERIAMDTDSGYVNIDPSDVPPPPLEEGDGEAGDDDADD